MQNIDWSKAWMDAKENTSRFDNQGFWNRRAPSFAGHVKETDYEKQFLSLLPLDSSWTVLDVGCAAGTLAIPLAERVASVTALDFSEVMLDLLKQRCEERGIKNVTPVLGRWEDDWESLGIGRYDVAIASRSLVINNLADGIAKLDQAACKMVCISALVGDGPFDRRIIEAAGRELKMGPDYIYVYGYLHQLGIYADVSYIVSSDWKSYANHSEALEKMLWMFEDLTAEEEVRLKKYLEETLVPHEEGWRMPEPKVTRWAFISWVKSRPERSK